MNILAHTNLNLQSKLAMGLLIVLCLFRTGSAVAVTSTDHDVVIVGAGTAGLYAAYVLNGLGYDVLLLEATNRHGGRCYPDTLGDVGIEHGAEEIYGNSGGNNFVWTDIVNEFGSGDLINWYQGPTLIVLDSDDPNGPKQIWTNTGDHLLDPDVNHWWNYSSGIYSNHPTDPLQSTFLTDPAGWNVDPNNRAYHLYETDTGFWGTSTDRIGLRSYSRERNAFELGGALGHRTMGYLDLLNVIYFNQVTGPGDILYNTPVTVVDTSGIKPVAIDANGDYHYADAIIVTVSLGVLKANLIDFIPDHSVEKQLAIDTIGMGRGMKIFLRFSSKFWPNFSYVYTDGPSQFCYSNNRVKTTANDYVITCFLMGTGADEMDALPDKPARINQAVTDLDVAFGAPGDETPASDDFIEGHVHDWTSEPYVLGSYSYPAPGTRPGYPTPTETMRQKLAKPVGSTLYFAGEATNNKNAATVVGAIQTGKRAGEEVDSTFGGPPAAGTPTANFSASVISGTAPLDVTFTDSSSDSPSQWSWDFGDAGISSDQHPNYQFTTPGVFTVSLTATNANGSHTRVMPMLITVGAAAPCLYPCGDLDDSGGDNNLTDFALLAKCWGENPITNSSCVCANLVEYDDHVIDLFDLQIFAELFLSSSLSYAPNNCSSSITDPYAPSPDPMTFLVVPTVTTYDTITMTATAATDISNVEYYFTNTAGGGNDSGWQDDRTYTDTGLAPNTSYSYTVMARDKSVNQNTTAPSGAESATTPQANILLPANGGALEFFTSEYGGGFLAEDLTNGITNEDGWSSVTSPTEPQEFIYSFSGGNNATLDEAVLHTGTAEGSGYYSENYEVWTADDGADYTLATFSMVASGTLLEQTYSVTVDLGDIEAKWVKLVITSGYDDWWELAEFEVYGIIE